MGKPFFERVKSEARHDHWIVQPQRVKSIE
jgi:hypothetical protein